MIVVAQRVSRARVTARRDDGSAHDAAIGVGLAALVCAMRGDTDAEARWMADKLAMLRIFPDNTGKMNRSVVDVGGGALVVSQFTLAGDVRKGTRPSFVNAAPPDVAAPLVELVAERMRAEHGLTVETGVFGASMQVELVNDGPVTILLERKEPGSDGD